MKQILTKKKRLFIILIFSTVLYVSGQEKETYTLTVNISGLDSNKGTLIVGIYTNENDFLKNQFRSDVIKIKNNEAYVIFKNLAAGEYAVSFIHDENNNNKMDTNLFGIPKEKYGCSNNARGFMGPPKYIDAKFKLIKNRTIEISM
jgi:uncharacterized protein (DUF2141 family)